MSSSIELNKEHIIDLLNRCWMTHYRMWFSHCMKEFGIAKANEMNKSAIKSLAPLEVDRIKKALGIEKKNVPEILNSIFTFYNISFLRLSLDEIRRTCAF